jgi:hypothetical protein
MLLFHERVLVKVKDRDAIKQWFNNGGFGGVTVAQELLLLRIAESLVLDGRQGLVYIRVRLGCVSVPSLARSESSYDQYVPMSSYHGPIGADPA